MVFNYSKLLGKIREKDMTQADVASAIGINLATLNAKINGRSYFTSYEIINLCSLLEIPKAEIGSYFFTKEV